MKLRRWAWRLGVLLLTAVACLAGLGLWLTRPAVLRLYLDDLLARYEAHVVSLGSLQFTPWRGIEARGVYLRGSERTSGLQVDRLLIRCNTSGLFSGKFEPTSIELGHVNAEMTISGGVGAPDQPTQLDRWHAERALLLKLPRVRAESADLELYVQDERGRRLLRRVVLRVEGDPLLAADGTRDGYGLRLVQTAGAVAAAPGSDLEALLSVDWRGARFQASSGWVELRLVEALAPGAFEHLTPTGVVRLADIQYENERLDRLVVEIAGLATDVPIEDKLPPGQPPFLRLSDVRGSLALERQPAGASGQGIGAAGARVRADLQAGLHGGQVQLSAVAEDVAIPARPGDALSALRGLDWSSQIGEATLQARDVRLPTADTFPDFIDAEKLPGAVRSFFRKYDPRGSVDLDLEARRSPGDSAWAVTGRLTPRAASCRYIHFPYLVDRLHGAVSFGPDGIRFEGLSGWHAGTSVRCDGHVAHSEAWTALHLRIVGRNVALNGDLYDALPDRYRALWHYANPQGLADVYVDIRRPEGDEATGPLPPEIDVDAQLVSAALTLNDRRLTHAAGRLRIRGDQIDLNNITGDIGDAATRLSGPLRFAGPGAPLEMDLAVRSQGVRFDHRVTPRDRSGQPLGEVRFTGRGDLTGQVRRADLADDSRYTVVVNDGVLTGFDPAIRMAGATGGMRIDPEWIWLDELRAGTPDLWVELNGRAPRFFDRAFEIDLRAGTNDMPTLRRAIIPERWRDVVGALGVSGAGKLQARLYGGATASPASGERLAEVEIEAAAMSPTDAPLPLRDVKGRLNLNSQGYEIGQSTARIGDAGQVEVSGRGGWEPAAWSQLAFDMRGVKLTREVAAGMPAGLAVLLKRLAASGTFETVGDRLRVARQADGQWEAGGRLAIRGGAMDLGLELRDLDGEISGSVQIPTAGPALVTADFVIDRGKLAGRPIERWEGHIVRAAGDAGLRLDDVRGRWCDGELIGFGTIDPESLEYEASITLQDVSFEQAFARANQPLPPAGAARVDGRVFVEGVGNDPGSRRGGGDLRLRGGSLRGSPVTAPLVEASRAGARPIDENIEQAEFRFVWEGRLLRFNRVLIETKGDSLIGEGFFDTDSQRISLTLISAPPRRARLLVIDDLLNLAREELVQYRIEGTLSEAKVRIEPLHNLAEMLRRIVAP